MPKGDQTGFEGGLVQDLRKLGGPEILKTQTPTSTAEDCLYSLVTSDWRYRHHGL